MYVHSHVNCTISFQDFSNETTILDEVVSSRGHYCWLLPKFHCELNPIEMCWCHAKKYSRAHCNGSIIRLRSVVPQALATVSATTIYKFFLKSKDYERAYREDHSCYTVDKAIKEYKSHRRVH